MCDCTFEFNWRIRESERLEEASKIAKPSAALCVVWVGDLRKEKEKNVVNFEP